MELASNARILYAKEEHINPSDLFSANINRTYDDVSPKHFQLAQTTAVVGPVYVLCDHMGKPLTDEPHLLTLVSIAGINLNHAWQDIQTYSESEFDGDEVAGLLKDDKALKQFVTTDLYIEGVSDRIQWRSAVEMGQYILEESTRSASKKLLLRVSTCPMGFELRERLLRQQMHRVWYMILTAMHFHLVEYPVLCAIGCDASQYGPFLV